MENNEIPKREGEGSTEQLAPSYATPGIIEKSLEILRKTNPSNIDADYIVRNNLSSGSNAFKIINFLRWIGVINSNNEVVREKLQKFKLVGESFKKEFRTTIEESYKEVFSYFDDLSQINLDDLSNFFTTHYNLGSNTAKLAAELFVYLAHKAGISLSESLTEIAERKGKERKQRAPKLTKKISANEKQGKKLPLEEEPPIEGVNVFIRGQGLEWKFQIKAEKDFETLKSKLESIKLLVTDSLTNAHEEKENSPESTEKLSDDENSE